MNYSKQEYSDYSNKKSPDSPLLKDVLFAFLIGGAICTIGQGVSDVYEVIFRLDSESVKTATSITMVFLGALLTGLNVYHKIAKYAGAGTIVPITGFANAITSPAMEFRREGWILGLAAKMFVVAGPVIVYGISASIVLGLFYYLVQVL
ncbi:MAG: stage V sporulation protein AC [Clostridia bacterium]|nr:stage V sporulation protein AC [Clostridia bacterium]